MSDHRPASCRGPSSDERVYYGLMTSIGSYSPARNFEHASGVVSEGGLQAFVQTNENAILRRARNRQMDFNFGLDKRFVAQFVVEKLSQELVKLGGLRLRKSLASQRGREGFHRVSRLEELRDCRPA